MRRAIFGVEAALVAAGLAVRLWIVFSVRSFDEDALITLRYGANIWHGNGWVFNASEHVLGSTSPLWTVITAPVIGLLHYDSARVIVACLAMTLYEAAVLVLVLVARRWQLSRTVQIAWLAVLVLHPTLVAESVSGMEASLFLLLLAASLYEAQSGRAALAFGAAALATLARPEGVLWAGCLLGYWWLSRRRILLRSALVYVVMLAPWIVFATVYFGSPIPQSALAKSGLGHQSTTLVRLLWRPHDLRHLVVFFSGAGLDVLSGSVQLVVAIVIAAAILVGTLAAVRARVWGLVTLGAFWIAYVSFYYLGYGVTTFEWYRVPAIAAGSVVAISGLAATGNRLSATLPRSVPVRSVAAGALVVALIAMLAFSTRREIASRRAGQRYEDSVRRPAGEWLARCTSTSATVMLEPIGYVGFFADRRVIDIAGLVSPELSRQDRSAPGWAADAIRREHPDYIVLRRYEIPENKFFATRDTPVFRTAADRRKFANLYTEGPVFGGGPFGLVVYERRDDPMIGTGCP